MKRIDGVSLIQLMIVVAVIGILSVLSSAAYKNYVIENNMHAAGQTALKNVLFMQKWYDICGNYARDSTSSATPSCFRTNSESSNAVWPTLPYQVAPESGTALYRIRLSGGVSYNDFRLIVTPICGTAQASSGCICIDQDSNIIENANSSCNNAGGLCSCTN